MPKFLIPEGFPAQSDLSGLEKIGQKPQKVKVPQVLAGPTNGINSRWRNFGYFLWLQAELSLLCKWWGLMVCFVEDFPVMGWQI